ncbi:MAG: hypothetical protein ACREPW_11075, partial [Candidatus Binataceae bacterium]
RNERAFQKHGLFAPLFDNSSSYGPTTSKIEAPFDSIDSRENLAFEELLIRLPSGRHLPASHAVPVCKRSALGCVKHQLNKPNTAPSIN